MFLLHCAVSVLLLLLEIAAVEANSLSPCARSVSGGSAGNAGIGPTGGAETAGSPSAANEWLPVVHHICENPTLPAYFVEHRIAGQKPRSLCSITNHLVRRGRIYLELIGLPDNHEFWLLDSGAFSDSKRHLAPVLKLSIEEARLLAVPRSGETRLLPIHPDKRFARLWLTVDPRGVAVFENEPDLDAAPLLQVEHSGGVFLVVPAGRDRCAGCDLPAFELYLPPDEMDSWRRDLPEKALYRELTGLERVRGFRDVAVPKDLPPEVRDLLPARLAATGTLSDPTEIELPNPLGDDHDPYWYLVQDFRVPERPFELRLTVRQVLALNHWRANEQYWGLYAEGRLAQCWLFEPIAREAKGNQGHFFTPREIEEIAQVGDYVVFRTVGSTYRQDGTSWTAATDLLFQPVNRGLQLRGFVRPFFIQEDDEGIGVIVEDFSYAAEDERVRRLQAHLSRNSALLQRCGWTDARDSEEKRTYRSLSKMASCIVRQGHAELTDDTLDGTFWADRPVPEP